MAFMKRELGGAYNIAKATEKAVQKFFVARRSPPKGWSGASPKLDAELMKSFCNQVDAW